MIEAVSGWTVAGVTAGVIATLLMLGAAMWKGAKFFAEIRATLGVPNGRGDVVTMLESALDRADEAKHHAATAASAAQLALSISEANGTAIRDLNTKITALTNEVTLQPGHEVFPDKKPARGR